ncbi:hypothetical protein [Dictyobacter kobayashii]|uniref:Uncharacterized protein n=1 Tax=Dictyobacter kobayashii TaxID=2014872 RepID=A0A402AQ28_9CHLR|nr:hypothetical protein [Dictyobacter kobayashii]GCE21135.1 hypothetical protein KDK_49350 [Dictyobacter kobayashii]
MGHIKWVYRAGFLVIILLIVGAIVVSQNVSASNVGPAHPTPTGNLSSTQVGYPDGVPSIKVHTISSGKSSAIPNYADTSMAPAFTEQDVRAFLLRDDTNFYAGPLVPGAHLKILTIKFVTAQQASVLMGGESVDRPDNYLVCYVRVQGPFQTTRLHLMSTTQPTKQPEVGDVVYDGHTGNMLLWGYIKR